MSSGKTHVKASLILASAFGVGAIITLRPEFIEHAVGALVGVVITPDLDVDKSYIGSKLIKKNLGWFAESTWNFFWMGYKKSFKHGQFASHFPVFGTFIRVAYVYFWCIFLPHLAIYITGITHWDLIYIYQWYAKIFLGNYFIGLASSDLIHYVLDVSTKNAE